MMESSPSATTARMAPSDDSPVLRVEDLVTYFPIHSPILRRIAGNVHAVDGVSFEVGRGEMLGLVGESGCGKSTLMRTIIGIHKPLRGRIYLDGSDITNVRGRQRHEIRRDLQLVHQNPYGSLNPRMKVRDIVAEPLLVHGIERERSVAEAVDEILTMVGLTAMHADRYPHEFSGGQRQRIALARALILRPRLLILDEPVSALDVSIQAQILNLLQDIKESLGLSCLMVAHDLSVVRQVADRVAVMYLGKLVEVGPNEDLYRAPAHPYTRALLAAVPVPDPDRRESIEDVLLDGDLPSPANPPSGCRFRTRCPLAAELCVEEEPGLIPRDGVGHPCACHFPVVE